MDLFVDLPPDASLLDRIGLKLDLEEALQRKVDVLTEGGISPYMYERTPAQRGSWLLVIRRKIEI